MNGVTLQLKKILKEDFENIFPILEKVYNHSQHRIKLWEQTVNQKKITENWEEEVEKYWKYNK
jgi:hypothetical protein